MNKHLNFCAIGDWGVITRDFMRNAGVLKEMTDLDFFILLGDNFYPRGVVSPQDVQWRDKYMDALPQSVPTFAIPGNHDYIEDIWAQVQYTDLSGTWNMPFLYHDIVATIGRESLHLFFIDSCLFVEEETTMLLLGTNTTSKRIADYKKIYREFHLKQKKWLEIKLSESNSKWKMICGHYPVLSNGPHTPSVEYFRYLGGLMARYGVDFYLSGHDHNLQHLQKKGINYIISGAFSSPHLVPTQLKRSTLYNCSESGTTRFQVTDHHMTVYFVNTSGQIIYSYKVEK